MSHSFRKLSGMAALLLWAIAPTLHASPIAVGQLTYIYSDSVGLPGFGFNNFTGVASTCGAVVTGPNTGCYPATNELTFTDVTLTVNYALNGVAQAALVVQVPNSDSGLFAPSYNNCGTFGVDSNCGDPNYSWQTPTAAGAEVLAGGGVTITSATLTGSFTPTQFLLTDGSLYTSTGTFSATLNPSADCSGNSDLNGNPTSDCYVDQTDLVTDVEGTNNGGGGPTTVPEPGTVWLWMGAAAAWAAATRRRSRVHQN